MSMTELKVLFPDEKLEALRFFMNRKDQNVEQELKDYLDKAYEKLVPAQVREYLESRTEQVHKQQTADVPEPESATADRGQPVRRIRRQREQAEVLQSQAPEASSEAEGPSDQESPGLTMSM